MTPIITELNSEGGINFYYFVPMYVCLLAYKNRLVIFFLQIEAVKYISAFMTFHRNFASMNQNKDDTAFRIAYKSI